MRRITKIKIYFGNIKKYIKKYIKYQQISETNIFTFKSVSPELLGEPREGTDVDSLRL